MKIQSQFSTNPIFMTTGEPNYWKLKKKVLQNKQTSRHVHD